MFEAGVPEKIIQQRTGHRSLDSLRLYERSSTMQEQVVSEVVNSTKSVSFDNAFEMLV